ncbi:MAG: branched-chain amino acid ABC transporter permease [Thermoleophilia bacterium]|jgi:branched-chain amino acid transport system permease protein|nr:branched-chain amino acid ABC transporter permease [Thermoleophilia bacterium]MBJ7333025.1 branched-chain amino acid ABC transporter permease [Thermoleophilia bacterium]
MATSEVGATAEIVPQAGPRVRLSRGTVFLLVVLALAVLGIGLQAASDVTLFAQITLNGLSLAGLYFIVASGFTLIFGLMRVVNMAHGSFYMLGGIIAYLIQERMLNPDPTSFDLPQATLSSFLIPLIVSMFSVALLGVLIQQIFLRWNQGQELRQALITIALSIIIADQAVARFGGIAKEISVPVRKSIELPIVGMYGTMRLVMLLVAIVVGVILVLIISRTRFGMIVRAGVDDRQMVTALGVNIQKVFAGAFFLGAMLAGLAGVLGGAVNSVNKSDDGKFLLISLVIVIVGGMGSLPGAAVGAVLLGLIDSYSDVYLPDSVTNYGVLLTFFLLVFVLAIRPYGLFGRPA